MRNLQLKILTKSLIMSEIYTLKGESYLTNDMNPFYGVTLKTVAENLSYAKEIYPKVFLRFANTYYELNEKLPNIPNELKEV